MESARALPGILARSSDGEPVGILLRRRHFAEATEVHLLAGAPDWHWRGIGAVLVSAVEAKLQTDGCRMLHVKMPGLRILTAGTRSRGCSTELSDSSRSRRQTICGQGRRAR
ncbi:GNAT family N-acetyltransferase [Streptomyces sp. 351MFTsu5.1]|uniref:GNAT family N-acetyltransferase n=1 Tax=Streptomyces sp. 351MFTsu5.1 TaxID=1172180 RepID=UPI003B639163